MYIFQRELVDSIIRRYDSTIISALKQVHKNKHLAKYIKTSTCNLILHEFDVIYDNFLRSIDLDSFVVSFIIIKRRFREGDTLDRSAAMQERSKRILWRIHDGSEIGQSLAVQAGKISLWQY